MSGIRYFISSIDIEGFRGINNKGFPLVLNFETEKANSVFAPNGIGKSSIFDALCFAIKGYIPRIEKMQRAEDGDSYYINQFHSSGEALINLVFKPDDGTDTKIHVSVKRDRKGKRIVTSTDIANPEEFLKSLDSDCVLVDYQTFTDFVNNSPLLRGRTFSSLIGLSKISNLKQALETLSSTRNISNDFEIDSLRTEIDMLSKSISACQKEIKEYMIKLDGKEVTHIDEKVISEIISNKLKSNKILQPHLEDKDFADINFDELITEVKKVEGCELRDTLLLKIKEASELNELKTTDLDVEISDIKVIYNSLEERKTLLAKSLGDSFYSLFNSAKDIFEKNNWAKSICPLCNTTIDSNGQNTFYDTVLSYISDFEQIRELKEISEKSWAKFKAKDRLIIIEKKLPDNKDYFFDNLNNKFKTGIVDIEDFAEINKRINDLYFQLAKLIKSIENEIEDIKGKLPPSLVDTVELIDIGRNLRNCLIKFKFDNNIYNEKKDTFDKRNQWVNFITNACSEISQAETELSKEICASIEASASGYFKEIMGRDEIELSLVRADTSEELGLQLSKFYDKNNINAVPILSESYRNALAMSIFLASILRYSTKTGFIVLDDVTSSFDAGHQFMLMEVIRNSISVSSNPNGLQVILLSHDGLLEKYFDSSHEYWSHIKLQGLPPFGNVISNRQQPEKLKTVAQQHISNGQIDSAYPLIRQFLEFKLTEIIKKLDIPVPIDFAIRDDKKMIGNSIDAIMEAIDLHQKAGLLILTPTQVTDLGCINISTIIANMVNHYETVSKASLSPHIFLNVISSIESFADCFKYDCACSGTTNRKYYKSLAKKGCRCR